MDAARCEEVTKGGRNIEGQVAPASLCSNRIELGWAGRVKRTVLDRIPFKVHSGDTGQGS